MKKLSILFFLVTFTAMNILAQTKYFTRNGYVRFYSEAPLENIEAHNRQVTSFMDIETGEMVFSVLMRSFEFEKALMQQHFNENYVESHKYPKSEFKGKILDISRADLSKNGIHAVTVEGKLSLHGVTKMVKHQGTLEVKDGKIHAKSVFPIVLADYKIKIPRVVRKNIAEVVDVTVEMVYEKFER